MYSFVDIDIIMHACTAVFETFHPLSCDVLSSLIRKLNKTTCVLDPFPTKLSMSHLSSILDIIICIVNLCFSSGVFPTPYTSSIVFPLMKKQGLDPAILKNYRPVANISFISKITEKAIATQILDHLLNTDIVDNFQSAYKAGHNCETALLRVYNNIVTTIGRGNGAMAVYLIYQQLWIQLIVIIYFVFLRNMYEFVEMFENQLRHSFLIELNVFKLMMFYQIFAKYYLWCSSGIGLGPLKFCLYMLPMSVNLEYHVWLSCVC